MVNRQKEHTDVARVACTGFVKSSFFAVFLFMAFYDSRGTVVKNEHFNYFFKIVKIAEHSFILKNNQNTYHPRFVFTPKTGMASL